uniref:Uncharacterized protein n=1 Tax=Phlebotomus papatasi TaxID=29031 RepID=A0A1B0CZK8_PHLPP
MSVATHACSKMNSVLLVTLDRSRFNPQTHLAIMVNYQLMVVAIFRKVICKHLQGQVLHKEA